MGTSTPELNRQHIKVRGKKPRAGKDCFLAPTSTLIGDVRLGDECSIWYNVVLRGDVMPIEIGNQCNIQDGTVIHGTFERYQTTLADRVSVGHQVVLHGCTVGEGSLIGMGSIIMDNASIGRHCLVGAGSLITENSQFEEGWLIFGRPARAVRMLTEKEIQGIEKSADNYLHYMTWYR